MGNAACYLDSNVCVAYLQKPHQFHAKAIEILINLRRKNIEPVISSLVLDETTHIVLRDARQNNTRTSISGIKKEIKKFLSLPLLRLVNPPLENKKQLKLFEYIEKFNLKPRDAYHLLAMKHNKIKFFATFDNDFNVAFSRGTIKKLG